MYDIIVQLMGDLPTEYHFVYVILALVLGMLVISFLFQIFYIPIYLVRGK